jgi:ubiquinone/menaquinone biosynthesis C-methylase UbiE
MEFIVLAGSPRSQVSRGRAASHQQSGPLCQTARVFSTAISVIPGVDDMYVCPDCKNPLQSMRCASCGTQYESKDGVPQLLSMQPKYAGARSIASTYDGIYNRRTQVWEDQGRTPEFIRYFVELAAAQTTGKMLEIGCGEGILFEQMRSSDKSAIDISTAAILRARARTQANFSVALAERLPFADGSFDLVTSVGVMEHFIDDVEAIRDIHRTLKPGGTYLTLIHVGVDTSQKIAQKLREYVFPPRPFAALKWLFGKIYKPIHQPIQRHYTPESAKQILEAGGLRVERVISNKSDQSAPLVGPHVFVYLARK